MQDINTVSDMHKVIGNKAVSPQLRKRFNDYEDKDNKLHDILLLSAVGLRAPFLD
jgi:hypothetical protein